MRRDEPDCVAGCAGAFAVFYATRYEAQDYFEALSHQP